MADEPDGPGWHLSARGERVIMAVIGLLTILVQSYFAVRVEGLHSKVGALQKQLEERPHVYYGEKK